MRFKHSAPAWSLVCLTLLAAGSPGTWYAASLLAPCEHCDVLIGMGTTFGVGGWTDSFVVPVTLELEDSRWELGAYRFGSSRRGFRLPLDSGFRLKP